MASAGRSRASPADTAKGGQDLIAQRLHTEVEDEAEVEPIREPTLAGFRRPVAAFKAIAMRGSTQSSQAHRWRSPAISLSWSDRARRRR